MSAKGLAFNQARHSRFDADDHVFDMHSPHVRASSGPPVLLISSGAHTDMEATVGSLLRTAGLRVLTIDATRSTAADLCQMAAKGRPIFVIAIGGSPIGDEPSAGSQLELGAGSCSTMCEDLIGLIPASFLARTVVVARGTVADDGRVVRVDFDGSPDQRAALLQKLETMGARIRWTAPWGSS